MACSWFDSRHRSLAYVERHGGVQRERADPALPQATNQASQELRLQYFWSTPPGLVCGLHDCVQGQGFAAPYQVRLLNGAAVSPTINNTWHLSLN